MTPTVSLADWLQLVASFAFVLGLLALVLWGLRRMQHSKTFGRKDAHLQVIDSLAIGPRQKIMLVRVRDQEVLVGVGPHGMTALNQLGPTPTTHTTHTTHRTQAQAATQASTPAAPQPFAQTLAELKDKQP